MLGLKNSSQLSIDNNVNDRIKPKWIFEKVLQFLGKSSSL